MDALLPGIAEKVTRAPETIPEYLTMFGLGTPKRRAAFALAVSALCAYALRFPKCAFTAKGTLRRPVLGEISEEDEDDVCHPLEHFAVFPVACATLAYVFL